MRVAIIGVGKVGRGLHKAIAAIRWKPTIVSAREFASAPRFLRADVVVIAARDGAISRIVEVLDGAKLLPPRSVVVHCAGALDAEILAPLRDDCAGVAQMHPMISFADPRRPPSLAGGHAHVAGDPVAARRAARLCRAIAMIPRTFPGLDRVAYHAAAGLVANGAAALAAAGAEILRRAGATEAAIPAMIGPLLRSVAENVETLGLPAALTGPVRRGDAAAVGKHLATLRAKAPEAIPLYLASGDAQLPLARALGDADAAAFDEVERALRAGG
jgi:predicted short-subunit dehydrogenase-like oxidoreductase (DUF2520 family)